MNSKMKEQRYDVLHDDADNQSHHSDSSTEVEESDAERAVRRRRQKRRKSPWRKVKGYHWVIDTTLLLVIVGLLVEKRWSKHHSHTYELAGDISGFAPRFSQQIVSFKPDPVFAPEEPAEFWSPKTQQAWLDIVPAGLGYVHVEEPSSYNNLPHPIHDYYNKSVFTTSMTHQLHCIYTILDAYNMLKISGDPEAIKMPWHINHCFEYIRQAIMCNGDVALEGAATTFPVNPVTGEDLGGSDGWDAKHVCKNYDQVYDYLEKKTINKFKWIASED